ncbi:hypothetical protein P9A14_02565 [Gordonia hongkongensis]|uniref:Uncharacterized protein n=1 Tax=Gordonia hongkongensis TaxID=1701090 RepID=A0AAX3T877_9ACTN|nr:hypothetical protein [Gordonia hongkongensis]QIK49641.1 hypothetical protein G8C36_22175 [Gordonia terrae]WFP25427.1 hypothetical protein P9A14_02565 [Gordonia hongkongensis]
MNRTEWIDRLCNALDAFEDNAFTTEQIAAITVTLETMMGVDDQRQAAPVLTLVRGDAS